MKMSRIYSLLLVGILANGCALFHRHQAKPVPPATASVAPTASATNTPAAAFKPIVTPDHSLTAKVAAYNSAGRFVVLSFPVGPMPGTNQIMFLYHHGLKVGEVKITGPKQGNNVVADLVTGTARVGDEVRQQ